MAKDAGDQDQLAQRMFSRRMLLAGAAQAAGLTVAGSRLFGLQVVDSSKYAPLAEDNRINVQILVPKRGRILDRKGRILADNDETYRAILLPAVAGDVARVLSVFRELVPLRQEDAEKIARRAKKQNRSLPVVLAANLSFDDAARINLYAPQLPGVRTELGWRRRYWQPVPLAHVIGYVGAIEKVLPEEDAVLRLPGFRIGKSGVEGGFDVGLRGRGGGQKLEIDAKGRPVRILSNLEPADGADVTLTIDAEIQTRISDRVQKERRAACAVIDCSTGAVLSLVSAPGFNPAEFAGGLASERWRELSTSGDKPILNRAISGQYAPGATFKAVTALAALHAGVVTAGEDIVCNGSYELNGETFRCTNRAGHGAVKLLTGLASSCDIYFFELARRLGIDRLAETARALGLGTLYNFGLPQEKAGLVPDTAWKRDRNKTEWLPGETLLTGIGQGYILVTPLQMAVLAARIASGKAVEPQLVAVAAGERPRVFPALAFSLPALDSVRAGLFAAVNSADAASTALKTNAGQPAVAGKIGVSQLARASANVTGDNLTYEQRDHSVAIVYFPHDVPRLAVATVVEHGAAGPDSAAGRLANDVITLLIESGATAQPSPIPGQG